MATQTCPAAGSGGQPPLPRLSLFAVEIILHV